MGRPDGSCGPRRPGRSHAILAGELPPPWACAVGPAHSPLILGSPSPSGGAVRADHHAVLLAGEPAAVMHQEAARACELVGLLRYDPYRQLLTGQIGARQFERFGGL